MLLTFRIFLRGHDNGHVTVTVPGVENCHGYGAQRNQVVERVRGRLIQVLAGTPEAKVPLIHCYHKEQRLVQTQLSVRIRVGRKKAAVQSTWSLLLTPVGGAPPGRHPGDPRPVPHLPGARRYRGRSAGGSPAAGVFCGPRGRPGSLPGGQS